MRFVSLAGLILFALATAACAGTGGGSPDVAGTWTLTAGTVDGNPIPLNGEVTLTLEDGQGGGTAACNHYGGDVTVTGTTIEIGNLAWTEMACAPPLMDTEQAYLAALPRVDTVARRGDALTLTGDGVELRYAFVPPPEDAALVGTAWTLDTLVDGDVASSVAGDPAELRLAENGTLTGGTGCRTFTGAFTLDGDELTVTDLAMDGVDCPAELMLQDQHVSRVLDGSVRVAIDGGRLTLTRGDLGLGYRAEG